MLYIIICKAVIISIIMYLLIISDTPL